MLDVFVPDAIQPLRAHDRGQVDPADGLLGRDPAGLVAIGRSVTLEMDRSTEEHRRLLQKYLGYWWYLQSPHFQTTHPDARRVNILFVTTGHKRMLNMMETLRQMPKPNRATHGGKGVFLFALATDYSLPEC